MRFRLFSQTLAGPAGRSVLPRRPTAGLVDPRRLRPAAASPPAGVRLAPTVGTADPAQQAHSLPAFATTSGTSAHKSPAPPRHRNLPAPAQDDHPAARTPAPLRYTACTRSINQTPRRS